MALGPPSVPTPVGPGPSPQSSFAVVLGVCPVSARGGVLLADVGHVIRTQGQVPLPGHHVPACPALCRPLGRRRAGCSAQVCVWSAPDELAGRHEMS